MAAGQMNAVRSSASIADVVGEIDTNKWQEILEKHCGATSLSVDEDGMHYDTADQCVS